MPHRLPYLPVLISVVIFLVAMVGFSLVGGDRTVRALATPSRIAFALVHPPLLSGESKDDDLAAVQGILWDIRLPRVLLAALVGMSLSVAGVALQGLLGNTLAEPYTIGVSSGAAVGAGVALLLGLGGFWNGSLAALFALAGALITLGIVFLLARIGGQISTAGFLLSGVAVGAFLWSLLTLLLTISGTEQREILHWLMGRLSDSDWPRVAVLTPAALFAAVYFMLSSRALDAFSFGEETARSVGVTVESFKIIALFVAALATAVSVATAGIIAFVGLIVPHCGRFLVGPEHRKLVPIAALLGAALTVLADLVARTLLNGEELPVGVITSLVGAPFFAILLRAQMGRS